MSSVIEKLNKEEWNAELPFELKTFNSIEMLNWAWVYFKEDTNEWIQFDCISCMVLESKWQ